MANSTRKGMHPLLAFFLGFLVAFIIIGGTVAGVVLYFLNYKIDKISANKDVDGNYIYINGDPDNGGVGTVLDLVKKIMDVAEDKNNLTLGELEEFMPVVGDLSDKIEESLSEYVKLEENELDTVKLGEISDFVKSLSERIDIAGLIGAKPDNAILTYLCYGVSSVKYENGEYKAKYKDGSGNEFDCKIELDENGKISRAYYTNEGVEMDTEVLTLENVNKRVDGVCNDLTVGEIMTIPEDDKILGSIKKSTINSIADDINALCIQQLFADDVYARKTPAEGETAPVARMYLAVDAATPYQTATVYDAELIYYELVSGVPVLAGANGKLTQEEFGAGSFVTYGEGKILFDPAYLYYIKDEEGNYELLNAKMGNAGRIDTMYAGTDYYTYGATSKLWKLLLYNAKEDGTGEEEIAYNFKNMSTMISNVSKNTKNTKMRDLDEAGILTFDNKADLETHIKWTDSQGAHDKIIGDMTLSEVVGVMVFVFKNMP